MKSLSRDPSGSPFTRQPFTQVSPLQGHLCHPCYLPSCPLALWALPIAPVLYPASLRTSARVVSLRGRPPREVMAKLWVTPLRSPRRPVSSEARDGEHVEAAEWKSTNLQNEKILQLTRPRVL